MRNTVASQRLEALSALLPHVSANVRENNQVLSTAAFGFTGFGGFPTLLGPFSTFDARVVVSAPIFDLVGPPRPVGRPRRRPRGRRGLSTRAEHGRAGRGARVSAGGRRRRARGIDPGTGGDRGITRPACHRSECRGPGGAHRRRASGRASSKPRAPPPRARRTIWRNASCSSRGRSACRPVRPSC